jgi:hypothetical protein
VRKIEAVDFFYLSMPDVSTKGDGSQDALLVRVAAGGLGGRRNQGQGEDSIWHPQTGIVSWRARSLTTFPKISLAVWPRLKPGTDNGGNWGPRHRSHTQIEHP